MSNYNFAVLKFGGTSVKNDFAITQALSIAKNNKAAKVIVVSAVSGITDLLISFIKSNIEERKEHFQKIKLTHYTIAKNLNVDHLVQEALEKTLNELSSLIPLDLTKSQRDTVLSFGERMSSIIVSAKAKEIGIHATLINAWEFIATDSNFGKANVDFNRTYENCRNHLGKLKNDEILITQGFIGADEFSQITTLGRGGSDYSAALLAAGFGADILYIYTDVKGLYTADPNIIPQAKLIRRISFNEMAELANFGAKVLHPATIAPCVGASIPIIIASTFDPYSGETLIDVIPQVSNAATVKAVTSRKRQMLVTVKSYNMLDTHGFIANVFAILAKHKISVDLITTSEVSVALTIDGTKWGIHDSNPFYSNHELIAELNKVADITLEDDLVLITVVGSNLCTENMLQEVLSSIADYNIRLVCYGASQSNIGLLVHPDDASFAMQLLHKKFL